MRKVKIVRVSGYAPGEIASLPDNRALTYARNGQAEPVGWDPAEPEQEGAQPMNRMLDTSDTKARPRRKVKKKPAGDAEEDE